MMDALLSLLPGIQDNWRASCGEFGFETMSHKSRDYSAQSLVHTPQSHWHRDEQVSPTIPRRDGGVYGRLADQHVTIPHLPFVAWPPVSPLIHNLHASGLATDLKGKLAGDIKQSPSNQPETPPLSPTSSVLPFVA